MQSLLGWFLGRNASVILLSFYCISLVLIIKISFDKTSFNKILRNETTFYGLNRFYIKESKSCPRLLVLQRVAQNAKSCSKVAEHNLFMPTGNQFLVQLTSCSLSALSLRSCRRIIIFIIIIIIIIIISSSSSSSSSSSISVSIALIFVVIIVINQISQLVWPTCSFWLVTKLSLERC